MSIPGKMVLLMMPWMLQILNTLRLRHDGHHFADDIFKCIFLYENVWIPIWMSLKFVPKGPINNIPALVQIMAKRRPGDKPLSEPMMVRLPTYVCVTWPQWVNLSSASLISLSLSSDCYHQNGNTPFGNTIAWTLKSKFRFPILINRSEISAINWCQLSAPNSSTTDAYICHSASLS